MSPDGSPEAGVGETRNRNRRLRFSGAFSHDALLTREDVDDVDDGRDGFVEAREVAGEEGEDALTDFALFTRDVAARVIQHHYRLHLERRHLGPDGPHVCEVGRPVDVSTGGRSSHTMNLPTLAADVKLRSGSAAGDVTSTSEAIYRRFGDAIASSTSCRSSGSATAAANDRYSSVDDSIDEYGDVHVRDAGNNRITTTTKDDTSGSEKLKSIIEYLDEVEGHTMIQQRRQRRRGQSPESGTGVSRVADDDDDDFDDDDERSGNALKENNCNYRSAAATLSNLGEESDDVSAQRPRRVQRSGGRALPSDKRSNVVAFDNTNSNAASVVRGVRAKMDALKTALDEQTAVSDALRAELDALRASATDNERALSDQHSAMMAAAKAENESAIKRHLEFIDRLLSDKDELSRALAQAATTSKEAEDKHNAKIQSVQVRFRQLFVSRSSLALSHGRPTRRVSGCRRRRRRR